LEVSKIFGVFGKKGVFSKNPKFLNFWKNIFIFTQGWDFFLKSRFFWNFENFLGFLKFLGVFTKKAKNGFYKNILPLGLEKKIKSREEKVLEGVFKKILTLGNFIGGRGSGGGLGEKFYPG
jgi:hypothetical protein